MKFEMLFSHVEYWIFIVFFTLIAVIFTIAYSYSHNVKKYVENLLACVLIYNVVLFIYCAIMWVTRYSSRGEYIGEFTQMYSGPEYYVFIAIFCLVISLIVSLTQRHNKIKSNIIELIVGVIIYNASLAIYTLTLILVFLK